MLIDDIGGILKTVGRYSFASWKSIIVCERATTSARLLARNQASNQASKQASTHVRSQEIDRREYRCTNEPLMVNKWTGKLVCVAPGSWDVTSTVRHRWLMSKLCSCRGQLHTIPHFQLSFHICYAALRVFCTGWPT